MKTLYIETKMGIAGDMLSAALLELCDDKVEILNRLSGIGIPGVSFKLERSEKCGIVGSHMNVIVNGEEEISDDVAYDRVSNHEHNHDFHDHNQGHNHDSNDQDYNQCHNYDSNDHDHNQGHNHDSNDHDHSQGHNHDSHDHEHSHDHDSYDHEFHDHEHYHNNDYHHDQNHEHHHEHDHHDHEHSHDHDHHDHEHFHDHDHHDHEHSHDHDHHDHDHDHHHHHPHRGMKEIEHIVQSLNLEEAVKADIMNVYRLIADAESKVHGRDVSEIHFHEVGTLDAIADIAAVCLIMRELAPGKVVVSPVHVGSGQVRCAHGILPVPAPATALLLKGIPFYSGEVRGELCTPTGAALIKYFATEFGAQPVMSVRKIGYGMGKKDFPQANCVRAFIGETFDGNFTTENATVTSTKMSTGEPADISINTSADSPTDTPTDIITELVCNLDDMTPEAIGFATERLMEDGALDVFTTAIGMKKNRPGTMLTVLCKENKKEELVRKIFRYTTTIGIRENICKRYILNREEKTISTSDGEIRVKEVSGYGVKREKKEYEDIAAIARKKGTALN